MAGGKFSEANLFGITLRESANDGSDFTNPDADYRRVFLGEDGEWHKRDSAGAITGFAGSGISATLADAAGDTLVATAADTWAKQVNNLAASAAPAVTDDSGDGYSIGSRWIDTTADKEYVATDVSVGAAVWKETTGGGMTTYSAVPAADVTLTRGSAFIAICSVSLPAGTYMAWAQINAQAPTSLVYSHLRISDGAGTVLSSAFVAIRDGDDVYYLHTIPFVLASTKTLTLEGHGNNGQASDPVAYKTTRGDGFILATSLVVLRLA